MCYHVCTTWVPQIIGAVPGIQHGESRVTTVGPYSPNVAMSICYWHKLITVFIFRNIINIHIIKIKKKKKKTCQIIYSDVV